MRGESTEASWCSSSDYEKFIHLRRFPSADNGSAFGVSDGESLPSADVVVARMLAHNAQRQIQLAGYRGMRRYVLENDRLNKHAEMLVRVAGDADETKHFEVVSERAGNRPKSMFCKRCSQRRQTHRLRKRA